MNKLPPEYAFVAYYLALIEAASRTDNWYWGDPDAQLRYLEPVRITGYPESRTGTAVIECVGEFNLTIECLTLVDLSLKAWGIEDISVMPHYESKKGYIDITVSVSTLNWAKEQAEKHSNSFQSYQEELTELDRVISAAEARKRNLKNQRAQEIDNTFKDVLQSLRP